MKTPLKRHLAISALLLTAACGRGGPTAPSTPPPATNTHSVQVLVFYDEDGNGTLDVGETVRVPEVEVEIAGRSVVTSAPGGDGAIDNVPAGEQRVSVRLASLPPYYQSNTHPTITVPFPSVAEVPVTLPIGNNMPNRYLAFGDSITEGDSATGDFTYRLTLQHLLEDFFGVAEILNSGAGGTTTEEGETRFFSEVIRHDPAITLIVYGTNDWNACATVEGCFTIDSLRTMIQTARNNSVMPFVATILPSNTGYDARAPVERNYWIEDMNVLIRDLVAEEGAVLMDIHAAFVEASDGDFSTLFEDHVHPNPLGYDIMARAMAEAITRQTASAAGRARRDSRF
jgi:lysophospholipase L1-like esterase/predicted small lipoprotein YifL